MDRPLIWVWGTFVGLAAGTLAVTNSVAAAVAVGASAACCVWLATSRVAAECQRLVEAFSSAARGLPVPTAQLSSDHTADELREVSEAAATHALLRAALDTLPEGLWVTAGDGTLLEHNVTVKNLLHLSGEVIGRHPREFLTHPALLGAVDDACRTRKASSLMLALSGASNHLEVYVAPLPMGRGSSAVFRAVDGRA